jgi:SAM-dependent methyltransferase
VKRPASTADEAAQETVTFRCNVCDARGAATPWELGRDVASCHECDSTPRSRAVIHVLGEALFGRRLRLSEFPERPDLTGIGLSDWGYVRRLAAKFAYRNTFYDREPRLDITDPPEELSGTLDFLISSDVFEHVPPTVERAFEGAFRLLKPGGILVLTVPYLREGDTLEWFPDLHDFKILDWEGSSILVNRTAAGRWEVFDNLRFHEGPGLVLEMRIFSHPDVLQHLRAAGFEDIVDWRDQIPEFNHCWQEQHSFPFVARRPA